MKTYKSVEELIEDSIPVHTGMEYTIDDVELTLSIDEKLEYEGSFSYWENNLGFIHNGVFYITPYTSGANEFLCDNYTHGVFYVPFSSYEVPKNKRVRDRLNELRAKAKADKQLDFRQECIEFCEEGGIYQIEQSILDQCFMVPEDGIRYYRPPYWNNVLIFHPFITKLSQFDTSEYLGTFSYSHGVVVFVYCDGHTYLAKGSKIVDILFKAGYQIAQLYVPFCDDEIIINPDIKEHWNAVRAIDENTGSSPSYHGTKKLIFNPKSLWKNAKNKK